MSTPTCGNAARRSLKRRAQQGFLLFPWGSGDSLAQGSRVQSGGGHTLWALNHSRSSLSGCASFLTRMTGLWLISTGQRWIEPVTPLEWNQKRGSDALKTSTNNFDPSSPYSGQTKGSSSPQITAWSTFAMRANSWCQNGHRCWPRWLPGAVNPVSRSYTSRREWIRTLLPHAGWMRWDRMQPCSRRKLLWRRDCGEKWVTMLPVVWGMSS